CYVAYLVVHWSQSVRSARMSCFLVHDAATTEIYTLSQRDALPISTPTFPSAGSPHPARRMSSKLKVPKVRCARGLSSALATRQRSEEHTSELQSRVDLVCRLLLEKKKYKKQT